MKKLQFPALVALLFYVVKTGFAQTPYSVATSNNYVFVGTPGTNSAPPPSYIYTNSSPSNPSGFSGATPLSLTTETVNGVGLNPVDGFLYAMGTGSITSANFYRVGSDGTTIKLGYFAPPGGVTFSIINTSAGLVDASGTFWFTAVGYNGIPAIPLNTSKIKLYVGKMSSVNTLAAGSSVLPVTYSTLTMDAGVTTAVNNFLTYFNYSNPASSYGGIQDIAQNPNDGKFYGMFSYPASSGPSPNLNHRPVVIDPAASTASVVGTTIETTPSNNESSGVWFDPSGNLYALFTNGQFTQIDLTTGAYTGLAASNLPLSGGNLRGDFASNINPITPTPVLFNSVSAAVEQNNMVNIKWATATEENNKQFNIERLTNSGWTVIGVVPSKGNSNIGQYYEYHDTVSIDGIYQYRIAQQDFDGKETYSWIVSVRVKGNNSYTVYPNPFKNFIAVHVPEGAERELMIFNETGSAIFSTQIQPNSIKNINLSTMPTGIYFVVIKENGIICYSHKLVH